MLYLVTGELRDRHILTEPNSEFRQLVAMTVIPSLDLLASFELDGRVKLGGVKACSPSVVLVLDLPGSSHLQVRELIVQLPIFPHYDWHVTPLETFTEWRQFLGG